MRKSNQQTLGQLLNAFVKQNQLSNGLTMAELQHSWKEIVGEFIAKNTTDIEVRKNILFIKMSNAACREELMYRKSDLIQHINKFTRETKITDIVIR